MFTASVNVVATEQLDDTGGSSRDKSGQTYRQATHVDGVETIDILAVVDSLDNLLLMDVGRQGQLYDETVDVIVGVEFVYLVEEFFLADAFVETNE